MAINDQLERIITALDYLNKTKTSGYPLSIEDRVYTISNQLQQLVDSGFGELPIHVCTAEEYDPETGIPTVENPEENTFYLVPNVDPEDPNMFMEYIYTGDHWELFGSGGQGVAGVGIASIAKTGTTGKIDTYTITYTDGTTTTYQIANGADGANVTIEETLVSGEDYALDFEGTGVSPVESVAGKTGVVVLDGGDVGYNSAATYANGTIGKAVQGLDENLFDLQQDVDGLGGNTIPLDSTDVQSETIEEAVSSLKTSIEELGYGYFTPPIDGDGYISRDNGEAVVSGTYVHSDYIDISGYDALVTTSAYKEDFNAFYDASKAFVSVFSVLVGTDNTIQIPATAKYMRYSATQAKYADTTFKALGQLKIDVVSAEIDALETSVGAMRTATAEDVGKALIAKTITSGKVTEWEFGEAGGGETTEDYFTPPIVSTGYISNQDGSEQANANYSRSDYVDISAYKKLITKASYDGAFNAFYTSAKVFISTFIVRTGTDNVVDIPSNAVYMRVSTTTSKYNDTYQFRPLPYVNSVKISDLDAEVDALAEAIANSEDTFSPPSVGTGNVSREDGSIVSSSYLHSDYIDISQFPKLLTVSEYVSDFNAFYRADKTFISAFSIAAGTDNIIEIPDGAMYMRLSASSSKYADTMHFRTLEYITSDALPDYWFGNIAAKCDAVRSHMNSIGKNGDTFPFVTDIHWYRNQQQSPKLIRYLLNHLNINMVVLGGDLITQGTKDAEITESWKCVEAFKFSDTFVPIDFGNHDNNSNQSEASYRFDANTIYSLFMKGFEDSVTWMTDTEFSFYWDKVSNKTRYICLDMGDDGVSKAFTAYAEFRDALLSTPNGYNLIIFAHIIDYGTFITSLSQIVDAYNARTSVTVNDVVCDFTGVTGTGKIVICIGGHRHYDTELATAGGVPITVTDCDAMLSQASETAGTITEQCFDVISIDYTNNVAYYDRVGRGESRIIHLTAVTAPTTLTTTLTGTIIWSSGDNSIATVSDGVVSKVAAGTTTIKADNGSTAEIWVCK